jgi:hypothetical protein
MRFVRSAFLVVAVAIAAVWLAGCPLLMVGSLGYTGYQYEKGEGPFAKQTPAPEKSSKKAASSKNTAPSDSDIE